MPVFFKGGQFCLLETQVIGVIDPKPLSHF